MLSSVHLMDFLHHIEASVRLNEPCIIAYNLLSTHFLQQPLRFINTHLQQVNVVTKNTSICQNISVQCETHSEGTHDEICNRMSKKRNTRAIIK